MAPEGHGGIRAQLDSHKEERSAALRGSAGGVEIPPLWCHPRKIPMKNSEAFKTSRNVQFVWIRRKIPDHPILSAHDHEWCLSEEFFFAFWLGGEKKQPKMSTKTKEVSSIGERVDRSYRRKGEREKGDQISLDHNGELEMGQNASKHMLVQY